jgi:RNase P subunit RPR2
MKRYYRLRAAAINKLGNVCCKCGFSDPRALQIDHIYGSGSQERKTLKTEDLFLKVLKDPSPYQLLCANCNWIKRYQELPIKLYTPAKKEENEFIDSLDIPNLLATSPQYKGTGPIICQKCLSENTVRSLTLNGKSTNGVILKRYTCKDCGWIGFYKF